jgi:tetratricopeptide (TPR) repeat protein
MRRTAPGMLVRGVLCLVLTACLVQEAREAVAGGLAERNSPEAIRKAELWDPSNPEFPAQLGRALAAERADADPREVATAFERSARLGPNRADSWARLGEALDLAGDTAGAIRAYERALKIFPNDPSINWQFANLLVRSGDAARAAAPMRLAIAGDPLLRMGAFDLAWRAGIPREQILGMIPARPETLSAYLDYLVASNRLDAAADVWQRLTAQPASFDLDAAFRYFDALLAARDVDRLVAVWTDLARHEPQRIRWQPSAPNRIANGGFEDAVLGGGFGWRIVPIEGAEVSLDGTMVHDGGRALSVQFDGKHNLDFGHVAQYVLVESDMSYRLIAYTRAEEITTDSGPRIAVCDPFDRAALSVETENLTGTTGWREESAEFRTGPKTRLIIVQVVRPPSRKLDNLIGGTMWLDDVSLTALH